jgi:hypothetical protein
MISNQLGHVKIHLFSMIDWSTCQMSQLIYYDQFFWCKIHFCIVLNKLNEGFKFRKWIWKKHIEQNNDFQVHLVLKFCSCALVLDPSYAWVYILKVKLQLKFIVFKDTHWRESWK